MCSSSTKPLVATSQEGCILSSATQAVGSERGLEIKYLEIQEGLAGGDPSTLVPPIKVVVGKLTESWEILKYSIAVLTTID